MTKLTPEEYQLIDKERSVLKEVLDSLKQQVSYCNNRLSIESKRSRDLTSQLVAATRDEDKAMLASDESVSHTLRKKKATEVKVLEKLLIKPYFARFVVEEKKDDAPVNYEYKLGFSSNTDCRIVDWRKAPISKLFYEYKEDEEYCEIIQGQEREGKIVVRNSVDIKNEAVKKINCRYGTFLNKGDDWIKLDKGEHIHSAKKLQNILSFITADQFRTITEDAQTAVLIQGIAGSGKTTVALHRLAWLIHEDNAGLSPKACLVIVISNALKEFVAQVLPSMGINDVEVMTYQTWSKKQIKRFCPDCLADDDEIRRPDMPAPHGITRLKNSIAFLAAFEDDLIANKNEDFFDTLISVLSNPQNIIERDDTSLIDKELILATKERVIKNKEDKTLDPCDDALLVRYHEILRRGTVLNDNSIGKYEHIVVDEVQDLSPVQLASLIGAVANTQDLTIVGDTSQKLDESSIFPGWDELQKFWSFKEDISKYVSLTVSHRSTLPIMKLAEYVQQHKVVTRGRRGRVPIWFMCRTETKGIRSVINWLEQALRRYPNAMTAVLCRDPKEAKQALSLLQPHFGAGIRIGDDYSFSFDEGIIVSDVKQVKGLEFTNVLIWNPTVFAYSTSTIDRNALYVAMTRAEENLCLVSWKRPAKILPHIRSKLVRGVEIGFE